MTTRQFLHTALLRNPHTIRPTTYFTVSANIASLTIWALTGHPVALPL